MVGDDALNQLYVGAKKIIWIWGLVEFSLLIMVKLVMNFSCFKPITELKLKPVGDYCLPWYFYKNIF